MKSNYINDAVYIVFDGTSYYGLYGCDIEDAILQDEDIEISEGPYKEWPEKRIEKLNDEL